MNVLTIDIGGTHVKILATGESERRKFPSGPEMTPRAMVKAVKALAKDWSYDVISIGYPGPVAAGKPKIDPLHLASGWVGFNFEKAFCCPVKIMNDAALQALGSYQGGKMLYLGLGTGLGTAMVVGTGEEQSPVVLPMELGHLPYKSATFEDYVGTAAIERLGKKKWRKTALDVIVRLIAGLQPEDTVIGGGNVREISDLPKGCRAGQNANAFAGGERLWQEAQIQIE